MVAVTAQVAVVLRKVEEVVKLRGLVNPIPRIAEANPMIIIAIFLSAIHNSGHQKQTAAILIPYSLG
jgi:hypothetical protein